MHQQTGTREGNSQRHTRTVHVSAPTQANTAARATNGNPPTRPLYMHLTRCSSVYPFFEWLEFSQPPGMGLFGCCGPDVGLHFCVLLSTGWAVRVQRTAEGAEGMYVCIYCLFLLACCAYVLLTERCPLFEDSVYRNVLFRLQAHQWLTATCTQPCKQRHAQHTWYGECHTCVVTWLHLSGPT